MTALPCCCRIWKKCPKSRPDMAYVENRTDIYNLVGAPCVLSPTQGIGTSSVESLENAPFD